MLLIVSGACVLIVFAPPVRRKFPRQFLHTPRYRNYLHHRTAKYQPIGLYMPTNVDVNEALSQLPAGSYGEWLHIGGSIITNGWVHKHWFKGQEGPANTYACDSRGVCQRCGKALPNQLLTLAKFQKLRGL
ncbi:MAG: hypothetical protein ACXABY_14425 [Candidatus Thorarchaeota archaeon]|jgi:hypothetical protein